MADHLVSFESAEDQVRVPTGTLLSEAARLELNLEPGQSFSRGPQYFQIDRPRSSS